MHGAVFYLGMVWLAVLLGGSVVLVAASRTLASRILALDLVVLLLIAMLALMAARQVQASFLDPAIALALLSFVATLAAARSYRHGGPFA